MALPALARVPHAADSGRRLPLARRDLLEREPRARRPAGRRGPRGVRAQPPAPPKHIATAMIALDIGLVVQHLVDPEAVSLDLYVPLFDLLIGRLVGPDTE